MKKSYILLHLAILLAGFTGILGKVITLNEALLTFYRVLFSAIILFIVLKSLGNRSVIDVKNKFSIGITGLLITSHWVFFYGSIKYSNISIGVICFCLTSCFTALLKPIIEKSRFKFSELALSLLTIIGIGMIFHMDSSYQLGIILGVISAFFNALYTIYNEKLVKKFDSISINFYQMIAGVIGLSVLLPIYLYFFPTQNLYPDAKNFSYLLLLASACTVGLYGIVTIVLKTIPAFTVNLSFNLEPLYSIILAFLLFDEGSKVHQSFYFGLILVTLSVILQTIISVKQNK